RYAEREVVLLASVRAAEHASRTTAASSTSAPTPAAIATTAAGTAASSTISAGSTCATKSGLAARLVGSRRLGLRAQTERPADSQIHRKLAGTLAVVSGYDHFAWKRVRIEIAPRRAHGPAGIGRERGPVIEQAVAVQIAAGGDVERTSCAG